MHLNVLLPRLFVVAVKNAHGGTTAADSPVFQNVLTLPNSG